MLHVLFVLCRTNPAFKLYKLPKRFSSARETYHLLAIFSKRQQLLQAKPPLPSASLPFFQVFPFLFNLSLLGFGSSLTQFFTLGPIKTLDSSPIIHRYSFSLAFFFSVCVFSCLTVLIFGLFVSSQIRSFFLRFLCSCFRLVLFSLIAFSFYMLAF